MAGRLIVLEGLDGSGKTTQTARLYEHLIAAQANVRRIKLPDYDDPSSTLVRMYLSGAFGASPMDVNAYAASAFYAVDRYASYQRHWKDAYERGSLILADRYTTSNAIHQMVKLPREQWNAFLQWDDDLEFEKFGIPRPDLVFFFDVPPKASQRLLMERYQGDAGKKDVHEADADYLLKCRQAALYTAERLQWRVISCAREGRLLSIEEIGAQVDAILEKELILHA